MSWVPLRSYMPGASRLRVQGITSFMGTAAGPAAPLFGTTEPQIVIRRRGHAGIAHVRRDVFLRVEPAAAAHDARAGRKDFARARPARVGGRLAGGPFRDVARHVLHAERAGAGTVR